MIRQRQPASASPPAGVASRRARTATLALAAGLTLTACAASPPAPPPTVIVTSPPAGDSGLAVLLTVAGIGAVLFAIATVVLFFLWGNDRRRLAEERRARAVAETEYIAATGQIPAWISADHRHPPMLANTRHIPSLTSSPIAHREATP